MIISDKFQKKTGVNLRKSKEHVNQNQNIFYIFFFFCCAKTANSGGFHEKTLVKTRNGLEEIQNISVGDTVFSFDICNNKFTSEAVIQKKLF